MLVGIFRFFKGSVRFRAVGRSPERLLNICAQRDIALWNAKPTAQGIEASVAPADYRSLRHAARRAGVRTRVIGRRGAPFIAAKYKGRIGLPIGAALGAALLVLLSQFVWCVNIDGLHTVSETRLKALLAECGVKPGALRHAVDAGQARRDILLEVEEIGWLSVNICGSHANVEVKEKAMKPDFDDSPIPCNVKAAKDGVITEILVSEGMTQVKKGSGVAKGDLLISGVSLTKQNTMRYLRAEGVIMADVYSKKELSLPKEANYYSVSENKTERRRLSCMGISFPCSLSFRSFESSAYTESCAAFTLNGVDLPLGILTETATEMIPSKREYGRDEAERVFRADLLLYEVFERSAAAKKEKHISVSETKEGFFCKTDYIFNENIAEKVDFTVEE